MCSSCNWEDTLDLAEAVLDSLEEYKTHSIEFVEDVRRWIAEHKHCTQKQKDSLEDNLDRVWVENSGKRGQAKERERNQPDLPLIEAAKAKESASALRLLLAPQKSEAPVRVRGVVDMIVSKARKKAADAGKTAPDLRVIDANALDWSDIRAQQGDAEAAYRWTARTFDACVLLCATGYYLGRGQFEIGRAFLAASKRVLVVSGFELLGHTEKVQSIETYNTEDWKHQYGVVTPEGSTSKIGEAAPAKTVSADDV